MSYRGPTANTRDQVPDERPETSSRADSAHEPDERNADQQNQNKGHGPLKGTDTPATTNAEDLDKAKRTTLWTVVTTKTHTPAPAPHKTPPTPSASPEDGQEGATEDQVSDTPPPAGPLYEDEPKQG